MGYSWQWALSAVFVEGIIFLLLTFFNLREALISAIPASLKHAIGAGIIREDGSIPRCKQALFADATGTTVGAMLGTSTITTYVESAAGVSAGGRTGLTAVVTGLLFLAALFLQPLFGSIPSAATAPILIIVGFMMIPPVRKIDFDDITEGFPAFMTMVMMVLSSSVSDGIMFGILTYVFTKLVARKSRDVRPAILVVAALFIVKIGLSLIS